jgi:NAD dependent epimerase/dehydratase family enzyme
MRIGVWGAGLVGRALAKGFVEQRLDVCVLNRSVDKPIYSNGVSVPMRCLDFAASEDEMVSALAGLSVLVHCAGSPVDDYAQFVQAANRLAAATVRAQIVRVLMVSTVGVYGDAIADEFLREGAVVEKKVLPVPSSPYGKSRYSAEQDMRAILEASGVEFSVVRIPMVLSNGMSAQVFKKLRHLLDWGFFPQLGAPSASLPCIRLEKLQICISKLVSSRGRLAQLYQFAECLLWSSIVESYVLKTGKQVRSVPLPGLFLLRFFRILHLKNFEHSVQVLMNEATYGDDSLEVLDQVAPSDPRSLGLHIGSVEIENILW